MKKQKKNSVARAVTQALSSDKGKQWARVGVGLAIFPVFVFFSSFWMPASQRPAFITFQIKLFLIFGVVAAGGIAFPRMRQFFQSLLDKLRNFDESLNTSQRLYRSVLILGATVFLLAELDAGPWTRSIIFAFVVFCIFVALFDSLRWYQSMCGHALGKAAIGVGFAAASTFAYAIARQQIAEAIHVTPTNFTHTTLLMAIMTIPVLVVLGGGLVYVACMVASLVVVPFALLMRDAPSGLKTWLFAGLIKDNPMRYPLITKVFQFFFYGTLGFMVMRMGETAMIRYESELQRLIPYTVYHLDLYRGQECKLQAGEKLAPLGDSKFLIGKSVTDGRIEFLSPVKCDDLPVR